MAWRAIDTIPIKIGVTISSARAASVRLALLRRAVPLSRCREGRIEPLATASLISAGSKLGLLTAAHVFEHASAGDLAVPLPADGGIARLAAVELRVIADAGQDVALIWMKDCRETRRLRANWTPIALGAIDGASSASSIYGIAGYPFAQTARHEGRVYAKPVVVFTAAIEADCYAYGRTAQRLDGLEIHTPELDGVSGAMLWAVDPLEPDPGVALRPVAVQIAFKHGRHLRARCVSLVRPLFDRALN